MAKPRIAPIGPPNGCPTIENQFGSCCTVDLRRSIFCPNRSPRFNTTGTACVTHSLPIYSATIGEFLRTPLNPFSEDALYPSIVVFPFYLALIGLSLLAGAGWRRPGARRERRPGRELADPELLRAHGQVDEGRQARVCPRRQDHHGLLQARRERRIAGGSGGQGHAAGLQRVRQHRLRRTERHGADLPPRGDAR